MLNYKKFLNIDIRQVVIFFLISKSPNRKLTFILYLVLISLFFSISYLSSPKLLNYSLRDTFIKEALKTNNNINLKKFKSINYKIFPTPRLLIKDSNFSYNEDFIFAENSDINIILNITSLLNYKNFNFKRVFIENGKSKISINNIPKSLEVIKKNQRRINFKKTNFIFFGNNKKLFKIESSNLIIKKKNLEKTLYFKGLFLGKKINVNFTHTENEKNNLLIKVPDLDTSIKIFFKTNNANNKITSGLANIEILNNFLQFNFKNNDKYDIENGFVRNKSINSSIKGYLVFEPNFYFDLYLEPNMFNAKDFFRLSLNQYLLPDIKELNFVKKLNGNLNLVFKDLFFGEIIFENGAISLENFTVKKRDNIIKFETYMEDLNKTKKVIFELTKKNNKEKLIKINGSIIPTKNKVVFEEVLVNEEILGKKTSLMYEKKFEDKIVKGNLENIFNLRKFNNFLKNLKP